MKFSPTRAILLSACLITVGISGLALAHSHSERGHDDDDRDRHGCRETTEHGRCLESGRDITPIDNPVYKEECGSCHMAYPPGLLPANSWTRVMQADALMDHFGDDASLNETVRAEIARYLETNAADHSRRTRSQAFAVESPDANADTLPRITQTPYFLRKHHEIPDRMVTGNPEVGSFSQCNVCHRTAETGNFNEHQVNIPGHGRWND